MSSAVAGLSYEHPDIAHHLPRWYPSMWSIGILLTKAGGGRTAHKSSQGSIPWMEYKERWLESVDRLRTI